MRARHRRHRLALGPYDGRGQLGDGDDAQSTEFAPVRVAGGHTFSDPRSRRAHACGSTPSAPPGAGATTGTGSLATVATGRPTSTRRCGVAGAHTFTTLTAGSFHTCGIDDSSTAWCWGFDTFGNLGDGGSDGEADVTRPGARVRCPGAFHHPDRRLVPHLRDRLTTGAAWCWGWDAEGQLGDADVPNSHSEPGRVAGGNTWKQP